MNTIVENQTIAYHPAYKKVERLQSLLFIPMFTLLLWYLFNLWYADPDAILSKNTLSDLMIGMVYVHLFIGKSVWFFSLLRHSNDSIVKWKFELSFLIVLPLGFLPAFCFMTDYFTDMTLRITVLMSLIIIVPIIHSIHFLVLHSTGVYRDGIHYDWQDVKSYETDDTDHDRFRVYLKVQPPYRRKPSEITLRFQKEQKEQVEALLKEHAIRDSQ